MGSTGKKHRQRVKRAEKNRGDLANSWQKEKPDWAPAIKLYCKFRTRSTINLKLAKRALILSTQNENQIAKRLFRT